MSKQKFTRLCSVEGCLKPHWGLGVCMFHYTRLPEVKSRKYYKGYQDKRKEYLCSDEGRARQAMSMSRSAAKRHGYQPIIATLEEVVAAIRPHKCAFCNRPEPKTGRKFPLDHCHTTGKLYGMLCPKHNTMRRDLDEMKLLIKWVESCV